MTRIEVTSPGGKLLAKVSTGGPMTTTEVEQGLKRFTAFVDWPSNPEDDDPGGSQEIELDAVTEGRARECVMLELAYYLPGAVVKSIEQTPWWPERRRSIRSTTTGGR